MRLTSFADLLDLVLRAAWWLLCAAVLLWLGWWLPWWLSVPGVVAIVAVQPWQRRWEARQAEFEQAAKRAAAASAARRQRP